MDGPPFRLARRPPETGMLAAGAAVLAYGVVMLAADVVESTDGQ
jgi:hypothetical protein